MFFRNISIQKRIILPSSSGKVFALGDLCAPEHSETFLLIFAFFWFVFASFQGQDAFWTNLHTSRWSIGNIRQAYNSLQHLGKVIAM